MHLNLSYDESNEGINAGLSFFDSRRYVVRALVPPGYERYFQEQARYTSAHTSTAIEGNPLNEDEAMLILAQGGEADSPAAVEKLNLDEAYQLMALLASDKSTRIDEGIIRTMNSLLLKGLPDHGARNRGKYRITPNRIVDSITRENRYLPTPPQWVPELMANLASDIEKWMESYQAPVAAALAHFGLISVHPFDDGNGRTARLLADMILDLQGWSVDGMLAVSRVMLDRRSEYYDALRDAQGMDFREDVDVTPFVAFQTRALGFATAALEDHVVSFSRRRDKLVREMSFLKERQVTGLMFMIDLGPISTPVYARMTESSQATALADLTELVSQGVVVREGAGRSTRYRLNLELEASTTGTSKEEGG